MFLQPNCIIETCCQSLNNWNHVGFSIWVRNSFILYYNHAYFNEFIAGEHGRKKRNYIYRELKIIYQLTIHLIGCEFNRQFDNMRKWGLDRYLQLQVVARQAPCGSMRRQKPWCRCQFQPLPAVVTPGAGGSLRIRVRVEAGHGSPRSRRGRVKGQGRLVPVPTPPPNHCQAPASWSPAKRWLRQLNEWVEERFGSDWKLN